MVFEKIHIKEKKMEDIVKNFLKGYSKSLEILPNFKQNKQSCDWVNIGWDIKFSLKKCTKRINNEHTISKRKKYFDCW